jgi:predicted ATPase
MAQEKYAAVQDAATALGMATAEFIRWVSYAAANEVLRIERETKYNTPVKTVTPVAEPYRQGVAVPMSFDPYKAR